MTSSLVGSEMCIRDSEIAVQSMIAATTSERASRALRSKKRQAVQVTDYPVSYTHLTLPTICSV
eukprot:7882669-Prorocentrum_lima.AAC.1